MKDFCNTVTEAQTQLHSAMRRDDGDVWRPMPVEPMAMSPSKSRALYWWVGGALIAVGIIAIARGLGI